MKRLLVVAAVVSAACGSQKPVENPLPPGYVTLGTFTGEVDTVAGTFSVRADGDSGPLSRTHAVIPEGAGTVTIANTGIVPNVDVWNNHASPTSACGGAAVTGAKVIVTQGYPSPTFLGAVYAEITSVSTTGVSACNSVVAPNGIGVSAQYGLWSHGSLAWTTAGGATTSATTEWNFTTASASRFTFSGRIVAMVGTQLSGFGTDSGLYGTLQDTGTRMVYAPVAPTLQFIKYDGTSDDTSTAALPGDFAISLAVDSSRIWFLAYEPGVGTNPDKTNVGYMNASGSSVTSVLGYAGAALANRIRIDPADPTRAFFLGLGGIGLDLRSVTVGNPPTTTTVASLPGTPTDFVFGANGNLFIASPDDDAIWEYTKAGDLVNTYLTASASCLGPFGIAQTSDGTLWFTAAVSGKVCTLVPTTATITPRGECLGGREVVKDESGNIWAACADEWTLIRFTPGSIATLRVGLPKYGTLWSVATSSGLVWSPMDFDVYRIAY